MWASSRGQGSVLWDGLTTGDYLLGLTTTLFGTSSIREVLSFLRFHWLSIQMESSFWWPTVTVWIFSPSWWLPVLFSDLEFIYLYFFHPFLTTAKNPFWAAVPPSESRALGSCFMVSLFSGQIWIWCASFLAYFFLISFGQQNSYNRNQVSFEACGGCVSWCWDR